MDTSRKEQLDPAELEKENGELLPDREAMSLMTLPGNPIIEPVPADIGGDVTNPVVPPVSE
jgi:hypothetical protein